MASIFKGMSKDNFLDSLVEKTGLNGHELFDYVMATLPDNKKETRKECDWFPIKDTVKFYGTTAEAISYLEMLGADEDNVKWFKAGSPGFQASMLCSYARAKRFEWTTPVRVLTPNRAERERIEDYTYIGFWNEEEKIYSFF